MSAGYSPNSQFVIKMKPSKSLPGAFGNTVAYGQTSPMTFFHYNFKVTYAIF